LYWSKVALEDVDRCSMCHELLPDKEYETQTLMFKCFIIYKS